MKARRSAENMRLRDRLEAAEAELQGRRRMVPAKSPAMRAVTEMLLRISGSPRSPVLLLGETGAGKEVLARHLHELTAPRAPFVHVNCAALPDATFESELFGHERGAFTGAQTMRRGRFEQAEGGTLFLDEIGDMPFDLQTRLLRVLSDGNFYRVGGHSAIKSNVRVIAATHQHLEQRVKEGSFREDLFHRLNVIRLRLPALRERREDIPMLARHFLQHSAKQLGVEPKRISDAALARLTDFGFPGNVRQLENLCHWLTVMAPAQLVEPKDLPPEVLDSTPASASASAEGAAEAAAATKPLAAVAAAAASATTPSASPGLPLAERAPDEPSGAHAASFANASAALTAVSGVAAAAPGTSVADIPAWEDGLESAALELLAEGRSDVWDELTRRFESRLILTALASTRGRRIEAAQKLGIGRNTITRKIQELGLE